MFKKVLLLVIIFSPLVWSLLIGFPVVNNQRNYATDDLTGYLNGLRNSPRIRGVVLLKRVGQRLQQLLF